jgi:signal transduction histidine kinase
LGLAAAIHEQARRLGCATVQIPAALPMLPSAVEVAAYRIAVEAMANAARHAPGEPIEVAVTVDGGLRLLVSDTGHGVPSTFTAGVGIASMRERAAECGGKLTLMRREPRGTTVEARLPLEIGS